MSWRRPTSVGCTLAIALICTATVSAQETQEDGPPVEPWTLGTLLERAEDVVPTYEMADAGVTEAEYQRLEARLARLPSISVNASLAPVPNVDSDDTFDSEAELFARIFRGVGPYVRAELTASVPIGTFGKIRLHRDLAEVGVDAAEAEAEQVRLETRFRIFQAFLGVQMDARISELIAEADERLTDVRGKLEDALDDGDRGARTSLRQLTIFEAEFTRIRTEAVETGFLARDTLRRALRLQEGLRSRRSS